MALGADEVGSGALVSGAVVSDVLDSGAGTSGDGTAFVAGDAPGVVALAQPVRRTATASSVIGRTQ